MKAKRLRLLLLFLSIAGSVSVWADTVVRFTFSEMDVMTNMTLVESGEVKLLFNEASGKNKPRTDGNYAYFYKGNTLNITASGHPIKQVVFKSPNSDTRLSVDCFTVGVRTTTSTALTWSCNGVNYYTLDVEQVRSTLRKFSYIEVTYDESVTFDKPAPPVFSIPEGEVTVGTQVDITSDDGGASIYYTTDGTAPTTSSTKGNSVVIDKDMTIRAIAVMFDISSDVAEATYTISTEATQYEYVKVTDVSTLKDGDVVIIVNETASKAMGKDAGNYRNEVDVTISGDKVLNPSDEVEEVTLESTSKLWYLLTPTGYLYADQKTSNYVKTSTSKQGNFSKASIAIQNGNAIIQFQGGGTYNSYLQYYGGTQRFSCYYNNASSPDRQIQLYRKVVSSEEPAETVDLVIREIGYASLYYSDKALIVPSRLTANTYKVTDDALVVSKTYHSGDVIPASTGVVFKGDQGNYVLEVTEMTGEGDENNMLAGSDEDALTVGDGLFFKLSTFEGKNIGFYWGAENGEAFVNKAHRAYLVAPSYVTARGFAFDTTNAINTLHPSTDTKKQDVYTLGGQRVNQANLPKGVFVVNGKKMVVR